MRAFGYYQGVPRRCIYDRLSAAVKKIARPHRELTSRFQALVSYYLVKPCFTRVGEGHDQGGVESRGKGIRLQYLTPIPRGDSLGEISEELMKRIEKAAARKEAPGGSRAGRIQEEHRHQRELPPHPFDASRLVPVSINSQATPQIEGARYSVPSPWARLEATAYVGVDQVRLVCRGETMTYPKQPRGGIMNNPVLPAVIQEYGKELKVPTMVRPGFTDRVARPAQATVLADVCP